MTIGIIISPSLSSPYQSVELQYCRCNCHYDNQRQHGFLTEDSSNCEHHCNRCSSATKVQTHNQVAQTCSLSSRSQSIRSSPPGILIDRLNEEERKDYYYRGRDDPHSISLSSSSYLCLSSSTTSYEKCVRFNLESSEVIPYLHYKDMTDEEINATWSTYDEKKKFRREVKVTKRLIEQQRINRCEPKLNITNEKNRVDNPYYNDDDFFLSLSLSTSSSSSDEDDEDQVLELCQRGLEGRHQRLIGMSRRVVIEEQERQCALLRKHHRQCLQKTSNITNSAQKKENMIERGQKMIATRYRNITEDAIILARQRARLDSNL